MKSQCRLLLFGLALALGTPLPAHEEGFPEATLKSIFPSATGFTPRHRAFTASQVKQIEQSYGKQTPAQRQPAAFLRRAR
jgi:hypothetical protein